MQQNVTKKEKQKNLVKTIWSVKKSLYFDWQKRAEFKLTLLQHYNQILCVCVKKSNQATHVYNCNCMHVHTCGKFYAEGLCFDIKEGSSSFKVVFIKNYELIEMEKRKNNNNNI